VAAGAHAKLIAVPFPRYEREDAEFGRATGFYDAASRSPRHCS
jgi:hypothetical protein